MTDRRWIDVNQVEQIEAQLASDALTDSELVDALNDAGLPELGRVVAGLAKR